MKKLIFSLAFFVSISYGFEIMDKDNIFTVKLENKKYEIVLAKLKDEINFQSFVIVNELNLGKSLENVAKAFNEKSSIKKGINILMCKPSFTYEMVKENISNINYCPLGISVYETTKNELFISFKKSKKFKKTDTIAKKINETLKTLILNSL